MKNRITFFTILLICFTIFNPLFSQTQVGSDIDGEAANDNFGHSVSLSSDGSRIAIGGPWNDGVANASGHARVYEFDGTDWIQVGADIDGEAYYDWSGFSVSLSSDGNRVAIGAPLTGSPDLVIGKARVYEWSGAVWAQVGADFDGVGASDEFGWSVSLSSDGSRVAIGAHEFNNGYVRIYEWNGAVWAQVGTDIDGEASEDYSGSSVSLSPDGSQVAIGARSNDGNGSASGHVRVYKWSVTSWVQVGGDIDGEAANDWSGFSVSLSSDGSRVAIGAEKNDGNGDESGHVRVYEWNGAVWTQVGEDIDGEAAGDESGGSISLSPDGNRVAIGARLNDGNGDESGHVRIYDWTGTLWAQVVADIDGEAAEDRSGYAVSLSSDGSRVAIGAHHNDGNGSNAGHVRVFSLPCVPSLRTDNITACDAHTWIDGNTYTESNDTATDTLTNSNGCDSIITLNLTINSVDVSVTENAPTLSANANGATYQWLDCDNNFEWLNGETNQSYTATVDGNYAVIVTQNNCVDTSECISVSTVNVLEHSIDEMINIFPNPAKEKIEILGLESGSIKIIDNFGRIIWKADKPESVIDISDLAPGIYFIQIRSDNQWITKKIIKK